MDIKIRNVPTQVANEIDKIAKDEGISQNTLYNKIISDYVKSRDDFVVNILPPTEKIENLLTETITNSEENSITNEEILRILEISDKESS